MTGTNNKLTTAVEVYFADLRRVHGSGGGTGELSYYPALDTLLRAVGGSLTPKVYPVNNSGGSGRGASRLRPLRSAAGAEGPPARGTGAGARRGRSEARRRQYLAYR